MYRQLRACTGNFERKFVDSSGSSFSVFVGFTQLLRGFDRVFWVVVCCGPVPGTSSVYWEVRTLEKYFLRFT